jgi:hypothetical protein
LLVEDLLFELFRTLLHLPTLAQQQDDADEGDQQQASGMQSTTKSSSSFWVVNLRFQFMPAYSSKPHAISMRGLILRFCGFLTALEAVRESSAAFAQPQIPACVHPPAV